VTALLLKLLPHRLKFWLINLFAWFLHLMYYLKAVCFNFFYFFVEEYCILSYSNRLGMVDLIAESMVSCHAPYITFAQIKVHIFP
jgi:hypothetical protein